MRTLFRLGDWKIKSEDEAPVAWVDHVVCRESDPDDNFGRENGAWFTDEDPAVCIHCTVAVPDEIQGLLVMFASTL